MRIFTTIGTIIGIIILIEGTAVFTPKANAEIPNQMTTIISMNGMCQKLIGYDTDVSDKCVNRLANAEWSDGHTSFLFVVHNEASQDATISFSGNGKKQIHKDADTVVQPIDYVFGTFAGKTDKIKAVGTCLFTNPYKGKATVRCTADTAMGRFTGVFLTDGNEPDVKDMR